MALITDNFWRSHFPNIADPSGQTIQLDRERYTIAGVLPSTFHLDSVLDEDDPQLFVPADFSHVAAQRGERDWAVIGRIKDRVSYAAVNAGMESIAHRLAADHPSDDAGWEVNIENLRESFTKYNRTVLYLFLGFAIFVLLIACANVAGLQLVRAVGRQREYALRLALGANRVALLRQAMAETAWIAVPGSAAGALLAWWGLGALHLVMPPDSLVRATQISMDSRALAFVVAVALCITCLVAWAPVLLTRRMDLDAALREGSKSVAATPRTQRRLNLLIACEMALSFVLLFGAGLFLSSDAHLRGAALGFDPNGVMTVRITAAGGRASSPEKVRTFYQEVLQKAGETGDMRQLALASATPLSGGTGFCIPCRAMRSRRAAKNPSRWCARFRPPISICSVSRCWRDGASRIWIRNGRLGWRS